jgi:type VI secretion system secreted protein VgrG
MSNALLSSARASQAALDAFKSALNFDSATRLYRLEAKGELSNLLVQAWSLKEELSTPWTLDLVTLSPRVGLNLNVMLGQQITLQTALADGSLHPRSGIVMRATSEGSDGGFARYRLTVRPWIALLAHGRRSQVWQDQTLVQIIESVFTRYASQATYVKWRWADDVNAHIAQSPFLGSGEARSYTVQYRETDLGFVNRLLTEEGISWRIEENAGGKNEGGHTLVLFADSVSTTSCPEDASSKQVNAMHGIRKGIRFHRASSQETSDAVQALGSERQLQATTTTVLSWDYHAKRAVTASVPTHHAYGGPNAPRLEAYDHTGAYTFATSAQADRAATLLQESLEARNKTWLGRSTVRTFTSGTHFELTDSPLDALQSLNNKTQSANNSRFLLTSLIHAGINNLPKDIPTGQSSAADEWDDAWDAWDQQGDNPSAAKGQGAARLLAPWVTAEVRTQAATSGYANSFEAIRAHVPWRPTLTNDKGQRLNPKPTVDGPLIATVVGADGSTDGSPEIHTDRLGRIRIRHDFQQPGEASTWVRVMQPYAGPGMGAQFIPRIGQQVLVGFFDNDIDRPVVIGALYDGRGEGGTPPTPGGKADAKANTEVFKQSSDHQPSAQGNTTGGHSPAWHGASPDEAGQRNPAALSGWKTKEFQGEGHNQLVFDDTDQQLRVQLATTQHATQLNLGHLIHQADNHRGSFRGLGFELRTDAYGTYRGDRGLLISSYTAQQAEPAGDNAAGIALSKQLKTLTETFSQAAQTHQTVQLASHIGSAKAAQSSLSDKEAPAAALHTAVKGMVSHDSEDAAAADAAEKNTATGEDKLPHSTDALLTIAAQAGWMLSAGQDIQVTAGETITWGAGQDISWAIGGSQRIHSGQAIGVLAGAVAAGDKAAGKGITLISGKGDIEVQAQADQLQVAAKQDVSIQSKTAHIDWAAAKRIVLSTAGGASLTIEGGDIIFECPGTITTKAGTISFVGPERVSYALPKLPRSPLPPDKPFKFDLRITDTAGPTGAPKPNTPWRIVVASKSRAALTARDSVLTGKTAADGKVALSSADEELLRKTYNKQPGRVWLVFNSKVRELVLTLERSDWDDKQRHEHALDAMGFTDTLGDTGDESVDRFIRNLARQETQVSGGAATLKKLKG